MFIFTQFDEVFYELQNSILYLGKHHISQIVNFQRSKNSNSQATIMRSSIAIVGVSAQVYYYMHFIIMSN